MANEIQTITFTGSATGGTWTITFDGQTTAGIAYNANAAAVQAALEALSNIGSGDVAVTGSVGAGFTVEFQGALAGTNVAEMTVSGAGLTIAASTVTAATTVPGSTATNETQLIAFSDTNAIGGNWTLTFGAETTGNISATANAADVQAALEALSNIGSGNVSVTGDVGSGFTVEFTSALGLSDVSQLSPSNVDLVASAQGSNVNTTTQGAAEVSAATEQFTVSGGTDEVVEYSDGSISSDVTFDASGFVSGYSTPSGYAQSAGGSGSDTFVTFTADSTGPRADMAKTSGGGGSVTVDVQGADAVTAEFEVQTIQLTGNPGSGTWAPGGSTQVNYDATSVDVEAALETDLGLGVAVTDNSSFPNVTYTITWDEAGERSTLAPVTSSLQKAWAGTINANTNTPGSAGVAEVQTLTLSDSPTGGTWTANGGAAVAFDVSAASLETNLEGTLGLGVGVGKSGFQYTITWDAVGNRSQVTGNGASLTKGWGGSIDVTTDTQGASAGGSMSLMGVGR